MLQMVKMWTVLSFLTVSLVLIARILCYEIVPSATIGIQISLPSLSTFLSEGKIAFSSIILSLYFSL